MKINDLTIGKILLVGVIISTILVFYGGMLYLLRDGTKSYQTVLNLPSTQFSLRDLGSGIYQGIPRAYVLLGVMILILTQLVRVTATAWMFFANKEIILGLASLFVLLVLGGSVAINI